MKLREFISLYSQGKHNVPELELDDFINVYDNGTFEQYDNVDDMAAAIWPLLDEEITYNERPTSQDVEVDVYHNGELLFNVVANSPVDGWDDPENWW